jgi:hypothetical protein
MSHPPLTLQKQNEWACTQHLKKKNRKKRNEVFTLSPTPPRIQRTYILIPPQPSQKRKQNKTKTFYTHPLNPLILFFNFF